MLRDWADVPRQYPSSCHRWSRGWLAATEPESLVATKAEGENTIGRQRDDFSRVHGRHGSDPPSISVAGFPPTSTDQRRLPRSVKICDKESRQAHWPKQIGTSRRHRQRESGINTGRQRYDLRSLRGPSQPKSGRDGSNVWACLSCISYGSTMCRGNRLWFQPKGGILEETINSMV